MSLIRRSAQRLLCLALLCGVSSSFAAPDPKPAPKSGHSTIAPSPDRGPEVEEMIDRLRRDAEVKRAIKTDPALRALYIQTLNSLRHVSFSFQMRDASYVHEFVLQGPYPARPTEAALRKANDFYKIFAARSPIVPRPTIVVRETEAELLAEQKAFIKRVTDSSLETYVGMRHRLETQGPEASFPELGPVVKHLLLKLQSDPVAAKLCAENPGLAQYREIAREQLESVVRPAQGGEFPYLSTVDAIQRSMEFFDVLQRAHDPKRSPKLYHSDRYEYYGHYLKGQVPDHIILPTLVSLGATDILKARGIPIGLVGVNTDITWVDGFYQTPFEFWIHDINHSRRMYQFFKEKAAERGITVEEFARESDKFVKERLIPLIAINKGDDYVTKNKKRLLKILLFEILHEDALAASPDIVKSGVLRPPNLITPFERIDGSVVSYIMEPGATTLAYVFRKLAHDFYDMPGARFDNIVAPEFRTRENIVEAAETLLGALGFKANREMLQYFVSTDQGFPADFKQTVKNDIASRPAETVPLDQERAEGKDHLRAIVAGAFHEKWQAESGYRERWKLAQVAFRDGRGINDDFRIRSHKQLEEYFEERGIPKSLRRHFSFRMDRKSGQILLHEDIQRLPNGFLSPNNQFENIKASAQAVDLLEGVSERGVEFRNVEEAASWVREACQQLHEAWQRRNQSWYRDYPEYVRPWAELDAVKQQHGVSLLKLSIETSAQLDPTAFKGTQKAVLIEAIRRIDLEIDKQRAVEVRAKVTGEAIHENWREHSTYLERWLPADARLDDGTRVTSEKLLKAYFAERGTPSARQGRFRLVPDGSGTGRVLEQDIRNSTFAELARNHQAVNLEAARHAVDVVDRLWDKKQRFRNLAEVERWFLTAAQNLHEHHLDQGGRSPELRKWSDLAPSNQVHDLEHLRLAFEARLQIQSGLMEASQSRLIAVGLKRLTQRAVRGDDVLACVKRGLKARPH